MSRMDDELEAARFRIYALQDGAIRAQALAHALTIGIFDRLERAPMTRAEIEAEFGLAARVAPAFLAFLASNGLIELGADGAFRNTRAAATFLVRASPRYVGGRGLLFQGFYEAIGHLPESLASGRAWTPEGQHDMFAGFTAEQQRWFADGMFANAVHGGRSLAEVVDFSRFKRMLDVGGNAGGYAIGLARANPRLRVTIFDLEPVRALALERIAAAGLADRIGFVAGSFFDDELPAGHDALLLSSILHDWDDEDCARILGRCYRAIEPGGTIIVAEPMLSEDATGPDHPAASGLTMALLGGENRTRKRIAEMLVEAGFGGVWMSELLPQNSVVTAIREG
jgi:SAM-dependent methyltransferase